jgi:hypothetical protein
LHAEILQHMAERDTKVFSECGTWCQTKDEGEIRSLVQCNDKVVAPVSEDRRRPVAEENTVQPLLGYGNWRPPGMTEPAP